MKTESHLRDFQNKAVGPTSAFLHPDANFFPFGAHAIANIQLLWPFK